MPQRPQRRVARAWRSSRRPLPNASRWPGCFAPLSNVPADGDGAYKAKRILRTDEEAHGIEHSFGIRKDASLERWWGTLARRGNRAKLIDTETMLE